MGHMSRTDTEYQGWGELAGYALDRAMGFYLKPPLTSRAISSKVAFSKSTDLLSRVCRPLLSLSSPDLSSSTHTLLFVLSIDHLASFQVVRITSRERRDGLVGALGRWYVPKASHDPTDEGVGRNGGSGIRQKSPSSDRHQRHSRL